MGCSWKWHTIYAVSQIIETCNILFTNKYDNPTRGQNTTLWSWLFWPHVGTWTYPNFLILMALSTHLTYSVSASIFPDKFSLEEGSLRILETIPLTMHQYKKAYNNLGKHKYHGSPARFIWQSCDLCPGVSAGCCSRFGIISSLQEIVVEVYEEDPSLDIWWEMESHGMDTVVVEPVEIEEWSVRQILGWLWRWWVSLWWLW